MADRKRGAAVFTECVFRGVRFNASVHRDAAFLNCTFAGCKLFDTRFVDCKLQGSMFDRCSHDLMSVTGINWSSRRW
jgi:fluoroquinolone resistance protein